MREFFEKSDGDVDNNDTNFHFDENGILWHKSSAYVRLPEAAAELLKKAKIKPVRMTFSEAEALFQNQTSATVATVPPTLTTDSADVLMGKIEEVVNEMPALSKPVKPAPLTLEQIQEETMRQVAKDKVSVSWWGAKLESHIDAAAKAVAGITPPKPTKGTALASPIALAISKTTSVQAIENVYPKVLVIDDASPIWQASADKVPPFIDAPAAYQAPKTVAPKAQTFSADFADEASKTVITKSPATITTPVADARKTIFRAGPPSATALATRSVQTPSSRHRFNDATLQEAAESIVKDFIGQSFAMIGTPSPKHIEKQRQDVEAEQAEAVRKMLEKTRTMKSKAEVLVEARKVGEIEVPAVTKQRIVYTAGQLEAFRSNARISEQQNLICHQFNAEYIFWPMPSQRNRRSAANQHPPNSSPKKTTFGKQYNKMKSPPTSATKENHSRESAGWGLSNNIVNNPQGSLYAHLRETTNVDVSSSWCDVCHCSGHATKGCFWAKKFGGGA